MYAFEICWPFAIFMFMLYCNSLEVSIVSMNIAMVHIMKIREFLEKAKAYSLSEYHL